MSKILDAASSFAAAIASSTSNCYWYGSARLVDDQIVPQQLPSTCKVPPPMSAIGTNIGWPSDHGFALIGTDADAQPLAYTDCSGLVAWLVARASMSDFNLLSAWDRQQHGKFPRHAQPWPSAAAYAYAGYASDPLGGNWSVVVNGAQSPGEWTKLVQPGDLLAWDIAESPGVPNDTGHIVVVQSPLQSFAPDIYAVNVIDSSIILHANDSRHPPQTGAGTGTIHLQHTVINRTAVWEYSFGRPSDGFHTAPHIAVLRLNV